MTEPAHDLDDAYGPRDQQKLRLVHCEACGQKERAMNAMSVDLENSETQMKAYRRQIGKLKAELQHERREGASYLEAEKIFEYWRQTVKPNALVFGEDRQKAVMARLNDKGKLPGQSKKQPLYSPRYVCEAIRGVKYRGKPYDLKWICKDSSTLEYCHELYDAWLKAGKPA